MPSPSYWPIVVAFGSTMAARGIIIWQANSVGGLTVIALSGFIGMRGIYGWVFEPVAAESPAHAHVPAHHG